MRKFIAFGPAIVVLLAALVTLVAAPAAVRMIGYAATDTQIRLARQGLEQDNILKQIDKAVRNVADAVEPSVVHIGVEEPSGRMGTYIRTAQGSGWVYDKAGHIVTNSHVVRGASRIMVQFNDGRAAGAELVGQDASTDIAVLKVDATEGLFPVQRASGLELHQGDRVYAFGSPFGFKFSMSEGIVSGLGRDPQQIVLTREGYTNFIQTDAAVNPGNSGGPLVNVEGKLVGMNVAIATAPTRSGEGQNSGISFAIPLSTIEPVVEQLISGGVVTRGYLGISHGGDDERNQTILNRLGFKGHGVVVTRVEANSPAAKAGLKVNDVITKLNNEYVTGVPVLRSAIANNAPGDKVNVEVWRGGESEKFVVELGRLITESDKADAFDALQRFGVVDVGETSDHRVLVSQVRVPSPAYDTGIRPGARIVSVDTQPVTTLEEFLTALASDGLQQGRDVTLTLESTNGQQRDVKVAGK